MIRFILLLIVLAACEDPAEMEDSPDLPTSGTIIVSVSIPLPTHLKPLYFDSAKVAVQSREDSRAPGTIRGTWKLYPVTDSVLVIDDLPFIDSLPPSIYGPPYNEFRIGFIQPRVEGWGDRTQGLLGGGPRFGDWFRLDADNPRMEFADTAKYDASMRGTGYLSACYRDTGGHCHRDRWIFRTGPVGNDGTFAGKTHVILVDRRFLSRRDTVASGSVIGTYNYPETTMRWDVYGGCDVTGELHHGRSMPVGKWMRVQCPHAAIDLEGRWY
ncbi:MAG: hypothetical protein OXI71_14020 [Gemmatimonadota bacterium]|nr:hypothetical protein [Gemmatimonadota bacterium]